MLDKVTDPAVQAALLRIQQFINNLVAPSSSGGYDSLTGAGETATPGALVQAGPFTVKVVAASVKADISAVLSCPALTCRG